MHKRTRALDISARVKAAVWARDGGCCVICGSPHAAPNAHYISRAQGGLGVEENVVTLCGDCHRRYDQSADRQILRAVIREYLVGKYPDWDENKLIWRKW